MKLSDYILQWKNILSRLIVKHIRLIMKSIKNNYEKFTKGKTYLVFYPDKTSVKMDKTAVKKTINRHITDTCNESSETEKMI